MAWNKQISASGLALALSLGGLGAGLAGCAGSSASKEPATASKGADKKCGAGKCGGEKGAEKSCGEKKAQKGAEKSCGEGSCG